MAAAVGAGLFPDFEAAGQAMVSIERVVTPNPAHRAVYDELFGRYVRTYEALNPS
jgi:sugar (pentulose or hexulose) kinase